MKKSNFVSEIISQDATAWNQGRGSQAITVLTKCAFVGKANREAVTILADGDELIVVPVGAVGFQAILKIKDGCSTLPSADQTTFQCEVVRECMFLPGGINKIGHKHEKLPLCFVVDVQYNIAHAGRAVKLDIKKTGSCFVPSGHAERRG